VKDQKFISERIVRGKQALQKVERELSKVTYEQFNWKPSTKGWSIAECLEHLRIADGCYFNDLVAIGNGHYQMTFWEKYSPFSGIFGSILKGQMKEDVKRRMTTHKRLTPTSSTYELRLMDSYSKNLDHLMVLVGKCSNIDLDRCVINSPTISWITYSLRDALEFLFEHEHRHINQAIRVKAKEGFLKY